MEYRCALNIHAYLDFAGDPFIEINGTVFRVVLPGNGENTSSPPVVRFSLAGEELPHPTIHAITMQAAIGAACKVVVDRDVATMEKNPFEKED